jgi:hypothetical protein
MRQDLHALVACRLALLTRGARRCNSGFLPGWMGVKIPGPAVGGAAAFATPFERLTLDDLDQAEGVRLLSSVRKAALVHTLDGTPLGDTGTAGPDLRTDRRLQKLKGQVWLL